MNNNNNNIKQVDSEWNELYDKQEFKAICIMREKSLDKTKLKEWRDGEYRGLTIVKNFDYLCGHKKSEVRKEMLQFLRIIFKWCIENDCKVYASCHCGGHRTKNKTPHFHFIIQKRDESSFTAKGITDLSFNLSKTSYGGFHVEPTMKLGRCMSDLRNSTDPRYVINKNIFGNNEILLYIPNTLDDDKLFWCVDAYDFKPLSENEKQFLKDSANG